MKSPETHYTVTIYVAAPGSPLAGGGTSAAGHVYYSVSDGKSNNSYGFAPLTHGESSGPGGVSTTDVADYKDPYYSRTLEISKDQYETLKPSAEMRPVTALTWSMPGRKIAALILLGVH